MGWQDSLIIGIGQAAAIAPGLSRSGTTISFAMYRGFTRPEATRFSFILSAPIIAGAGLSQVIGQAGSGNLSAEAPAFIVGFLAAAVCGYVAIRLLLNYVRRRSLYPFAVYCVVVGALALAFL